MRDINLMHESQLEQSKIAVAKTQEIKSLKERFVLILLIQTNIN